MKHTHKKRKIKIPPQPLHFFSLAECQKILNISFAVLFYETPEGDVFKEQAREIIKKLQPII